MKEMKTYLLKFNVYFLLLVGLVIPQLALSQTPVKIDYFDGRFLTTGELRSVQISMPGLYNPITGKRSSREDYEKPIKATKVYDENSQMLADAFYNNTPIKQITIAVEINSKNNNRPASYLKYELTNVLVTSYSTSTSEDEVLLENITLSFAECEILYVDH